MRMRLLHIRPLITVGATKRQQRVDSVNKTIMVKPTHQVIQNTELAVSW